MAKATNKFVAASKEIKEFSKILNHPDRDQIITKLTSGDSANSVADWLRIKYPENKEFIVSHGLLDAFRRGHLNIHGAVLDELRYKIKQAQEEEANEELQQVIKKNKTYKEKVNEEVDEQLNLHKKLYQILNVVEERFGQLYDKTQLNVNDYRPDKTMQTWLEMMLKLIQEIRKVEGAPDQVVQHNVTIQAIDEHTTMFQKAFVQTLQELDLDKSSMLIDKFTKNLECLRIEQPALHSKKDANKIEVLAAKLLPEKSEP